MIKLEFKFKSINDQFCFGWIESGGNKVKGIVASGSSKEEIIEKLKLLLGAKIAFERYNIIK